MNLWLRAGILFIGFALFHAWNLMGGSGLVFLGVLTAEPLLAALAVALISCLIWPEK